MLRTRMGSWSLAAAAPICGLMLSAMAAPAHADAYLQVYDSSTGTYLCQVSNTTDAPLSCNGTIGSFAYTVDTGIDASHGTVGKVDLSFDAIGTAPPKDSLQMLYYVDDLTGNGNTSFLTTLGGTADAGKTNGNFLSGFASTGIPQVSVASFCGESGPAAYGTATILSTFCDQGSNSFSDQQASGPYDITGTYQLGLMADLNLTGGTNSVISGDLEVETVPEPATFALFGVGLLGCALFLRRRRVPNA
jgi:hypothetical protein